MSFEQKSPQKMRVELPSRAQKCSHAGTFPPPHLQSLCDNNGLWRGHSQRWNLGGKVPAGILSQRAELSVMGDTLPWLEEREFFTGKAQVDPTCSAIPLWSRGCAFGNVIKAPRQTPELKKVKKGDFPSFGTIREIKKVLNFF